MSSRLTLYIAGFKVSVGYCLQAEGSNTRKTLVICTPCLCYVRPAISMYQNFLPQFWTQSTEKIHKGCRIWACHAFSLYFLYVLLEKFRYASLKERIPRE